MLFFLFFYGLCVSAAWSLRSAPAYELEDAELFFEYFIQMHNKHYANEHEKQARFEIFKVNLEEVNRLNEGQDDAVFGLTPFMDLTEEEFLRGFTGFGYNSTALRSACSYVSEEELQNIYAPESFDWRHYNAVTSVKQQANCGSCYAFSALANIESQYAIRTGHHLDLAEQQIVDCDATGGACDGGRMTNVFRYLIETGGALGELDYPYRDTVPGQCRFDPSKVRVRLADCLTFSLTSQESLKKLLYANGPISIAIRGKGIKTYSGGLLTDEKCCHGDINHAVLLVGYGTYRDGTPIWIAKNSWGTWWGDQGYMYMVRGEYVQSCGMLKWGISSAVLAPLVPFWHRLIKEN